MDSRALYMRTMADDPNDRELRRYREMQELTVVQVAARGDTLRVHCMACGRQRDVPARSLPGRYADRPVASLTFSCTPCRRTGRKRSIHPAGFDTWHEILWPADRA